MIKGLDLEKFTAIIENFPDGILVFDEKNCLSMINSKAKALLVTNSEDLVGKSILEIKDLPPFKPLAELISLETGLSIKEVFREKIKTRENLVLEVTISPLVKKEERTGTLIVLHEVTREKMIERMKTEFVSLSAHQLRTPLSAIKWTLRMFLDGDLGKATKEQKSFIEKIYHSNERMIFLINDLLNVSRIEEGTYVYKAALSDIEPIINSVIASYKEEIKRKKIKVEIKKPEEKLAQVRIDAEKIQLAFQNFFDNAIRYNGPGGTITVYLKNNERQIEVAVEDSGIGIPKDQQKRVFDRFFRAANVIKEGKDGTGLGLYITKNIIEAHGGKVWLESEENKGSTFHFSLPTEEVSI